MSKQQWSENEVNQLISLTAINRTRKTQINWEQIAKQMGNRTLSQCKSYYANIVKKTLDVDIRSNHMWTRVEIITLWTLCIKWDCNFVAVQEVMSNFTTKQLQSQWLQIKRKAAAIQESYHNVLRNPVYIRLVPTKQFLVEQYLVQVGCVRKLLINVKLLGIGQGDAPDYGHPVDVAEIKAFQAFFGDVDPDQLTQIYYQEQIRRGLSDQDLHM
ncbi:Myb-like_DNA-binding domain-containing protein [Hexamita inflata]|uniref:Myb-like DNA-binding domain-containing protein n=1 Tax=Hexamita inflata TaxID=28002 RepID=A0AA86NBQ3_9EUKA|nr:Myb-like DNA-binding domain-containing protein [Hexamita inflata]CAI9916744.1 Myb-like DNA-binding domain-containing protein [Hexamita inflata]